MTTARDRILGKVRAALGRSDPLAQDRAQPLLDHLREHPQGPRPAGYADPVARFRDRAVKLDSSVEEVETLASVPQAVARYLAANGLPLEAVVWPELASLDWQGSGVKTSARGAAGTDLVGVTGAYCAVAETGTLLLLSGGKTPATTSLLPETHIAVVPTARIVAGMEDAWAKLRSEHGSPPRALNFVSGPSRTADIEQTLVLGAHGPYRVHIVLVHGR